MQNKVGLQGYVIASRKIIIGYTNATFNQGGNITRAEFASIVELAMGLAEGMGENTFSDISKEDWYCRYIETASVYGIIAGFADGTFGPNDKITRELAMTIVVRGIEISKLDVVL